MLLSLYVKTRTALHAAREHESERLRSARGVTFLEYALMAAIALAIFGIIMAIFPSAIRSLFDSLKNAITGQNSSANTQPG